ncbi:MAG: DUF4465 domain-containing protein [Porphyromonadaceae bacterium]|nr:DUF4465 domain-containing protein [Porphyromonadaceae bacterium]
MKRRLFILLCLLCTLSTARAQISMPQGDGIEKEHSITGAEQQFYDPAGAAQTFYGYAVTRITFKPNPGEVIHLRFESLKLTGATLSIFDGVKKLEQETDPFDEEEITYTIPRGAKKKFTSLMGEETFISQSADGALTIMLESSGGSGDWVAYVSSKPREAVAPKDAEGEVRMGAGHLIYRVGTEVLFYDDGGKSGKITENFEGLITFQPKTPGKKIKVTFTKLDLFSTYEPKNDVLKVFSGSKAEEGKLLAQLLKDATPISLVSTAEDGSLTVSLKSTTGVTKPGFEATVEEYEAAPMSIAEVSLRSGQTVKAAAGDNDVYALGFDVVMNGSLSPISLSSLDLTAVGVAHISGVKLYSTGRTTSGYKTLLGEFSPTTDNYTLPLSATYELREGHNYFQLEYSLKATAPAGATLDAGLRALGLSSGMHHIQVGEAAGNIQVENTYISKVGKRTIDLYGPWQYTHEVQSVYSTKYKAENGRQVVTFRPMTLGAKVELNFTAFDLYYATNPHGTRAKFEIYNGATPSGTKLFELKDAAQKSQLPLGGLVRSTSEDGSLTVVFDASTSTSYYTANGWQATAQEYISKPMSLVGTRLFQTDLSDVAPGARQQAILGIELTTEGDESPLQLQALELDLKASLASVERVHIFKTTGEAFASTTSLGDTAPDVQKQNYSLSTPLSLTEGKNYLWVVYDIKADAVPESILDATLTKLTLSGNVQAVIAEEPAGQRTVKSIYIWKNQDDVLQLGAYPVLFYDAGGANGNYASASKAKLHIKPREGEVVKVRFIKFNTLRTDNFVIYRGNSTDDADRVASLSGNKNNAPNILGQEPDGSLTISFEPKSRGTTGWEIELTSHKLTEFAVKSVRAEAIQPQVTLLGGQSDVALIKIAVEVDGDFGTAALPSLKIKQLAGSLSALASEFSLYDAQQHETFATNNRIAQVSELGSEVLLTTTHHFTSAGTHYLWLAVDAKSELIQGAEASLKLISRGWASSITEQLEAQVQLSAKRGLSGRHIVGASSAAKYASLAAAWADLKEKGIEGAVELALEPGTYTGPFELTAVPGASDRNRITITSTDKQPSSVTLELNVPKSSRATKVIGLEQADYVTLEGLTISTTQVSYEAVVQVVRSRHFMMKDCCVKAPKSINPTGETLSLVSIIGGREAYQNSDYATVENCKLEGGYKGLELRGNGMIALPKQKGGIVRGNTFSDQGSISCYSLAEDGLTVEGNSFTARGDIHGPYKAIDVELLGNATIKNNKIDIAAITGPRVGYNSANANINAIYLRKHRLPASLPGVNLIVNNTVDILGDDKMADMYAIYLSDSGIEGLNILHNTVRVAPAGEGINLGTKRIAALAIVGRGNEQLKDINVRGNLFQIKAEVGAAYRIQFAQHKAALSFDHNAVFAPEASFVEVGTTKTTLTDWQAEGQDTHSVHKEATFAPDGLELLDDDGLRIVPTLAGAERDIVGRERTTIGLSTAGAYEFKDITVPQLTDGSLSLVRTTATIAVIKLRPSASGQVYAKLIEVGEAAPSLDDLKASAATSIVGDEEVTVTLEQLKPNTTYKLHLLFKSLKDRFGEPVATELEVRTGHLPTAVATFETAEQEEGAEFQDGTFEFLGFELVTTSGYNAESKRIAKTSGEGYIMPTNTDDAITLNGLFIKSDQDVTLKSQDLSSAEATEKTLQVTPQGKGWVYVDLKKISPISILKVEGSGEVFIDDVAGNPLALTLDASALEAKLDKGATLNREAMPQGGVYPYTYEWRSSIGGILGSEAKLSYQPRQTQMMSLKVTDAWGNTQTVNFLVLLRGVQTMASFEDLTLSPESHWIGDETMSKTSFVSGSYRFDNQYYPDLASWSGYAYSNQTATHFQSLFPDQFNSAVGHGALGSKNYAVAYPQGGNKLYPLANDGSAELVSGFYVTNSAWVTTVTTQGTGMGADPNKPFGTGDWLCLTAKGSNGRTAEFYLVDYRSANPQEHYALSSWQWFDLSSLGEVEHISFSMDGTRKNQYGTTIPTYFCMDNLGGQPEKTQLAKLSLTLGASHESDLKQLLRANLPTAWGDLVKFSLVQTNKVVGIESSLSDAKLSLKATAKGEHTLLVKAQARGEAIYFELPVEISEPASVTDMASETFLHAYPNPAVAYVKLSSGGHLRIYTLSGIMVYESQEYHANTPIAVDSWASGIYIAELAGQSIRWYKR